MFKGVAHPPPARSTGNVADLNAAEIATTNMGRGSGTDLLVEHDAGARVGTVHASWAGRNGELRVAGSVSDPQAAAAVRRGDLRGLSLGTSVIQTTNGTPLLRTQDELSLCEAPRRAGCYIDTVDGKSVHTNAQFSNAAHGASSPLSHSHKASLGQPQSV
jgi:hypothetical protein